MGRITIWVLNLFDVFITYIIYALIADPDSVTSNVIFYFVAMIDSVGGSTRVNNLLATLNIKPIDEENLKKMERRAGQAIEAVADTSMAEFAAKAFSLEMK